MDLTVFKNSDAYKTYCNNHFKYRAKSRNNIHLEFADIEIGKFFVFAYEIKGRYHQKYTPILRKTSEYNYEFNIGCSVFNDNRKTYTIPKIKGSSYMNTRVLEARQENDGNWVLNKYLR